jgi:putative hydrolase of the HAD superfamily
MVTSFEAKCYKPGERIFKHTVEKFNIIPAETLFLDDSAANTAAAAKLGFQTLTVIPGTEFYDLLANTL